MFAFTYLISSTSKLLVEAVEVMELHQCQLVEVNECKDFYGFHSMVDLVEIKNVL